MPLSAQQYARARAQLLADPIPELDGADAAAVDELSRLGAQTRPEQTEGPDGSVGALNAVCLGVYAAGLHGCRGAEQY